LRNGVERAMEASAPSQSAASGSKCCPHCSQNQTGPLCKVDQCCKISYPIGSNLPFLQQSSIEPRIFVKSDSARLHA